MAENENPQTPPIEQPKPEPLSEDRFKNFQSEMSRKLENTNAQLQQVLNSLKPTTPPPSQPKHVSVFEDETKFAESIKEQTKREIMQLAAEQNRTQAVVNKIYQDFPEAADQESDLFKRASDIYKGLDEHERASPIAMKSSIAEAAAELGIKPKSKRTKVDNDNFSIGGPPTGTKSKKDGDIDNSMLEFAARMGKDIKDPKYLQRLKEASKRTNWKKYQ